LLAILIQETTPSLQDRANHALLRQILDPTSNMQASDDNMSNLQTLSNFVLKYYSNVGGPASQEVHDQARIAEKRRQFSSVHRDIRKIGET